MADKPFSSPSSMTEQLQNLCWRLATEMRALYNTVALKLTKSEADGYYLGKTDKAASATTADSATKATQDGNGNVISSTYAKNSSIPTSMKGATSSTAGSAGTVPAPAAGKQTSFLRGDGTWVVPTDTTYSAMTAATSSAAGKSGLVPAPAAGKQTSFLRGDGAWVVPTDTTYSAMTAATSSAAGKSGLVPAPAAGKQTSFLRGDGTWVNVSSGVAPTGARGSLAGYETMSVGTTVSATSADAQTASSVTISDGSSGTSWTKIVGLSANATVTLGSSWHWVGGEAPELSAAGVLVCCWASTIGICSFASSGS